MRRSRRNKKAKGLNYLRRCLSQASLISQTAIINMVTTKMGPERRASAVSIYIPELTRLLNAQGARSFHDPSKVNGGRPRRAPYG
jgi:hypothetical protein